MPQMKRFHGKKKFNALRDIIRDAANKSKNIEWHGDSELAKGAVWTCDRDWETTR